MGPEYHITFTVYNGGPGTTGTSYNVDQHLWNVMLEYIQEHFGITPPKDAGPEQKQED